MELILIYKGIAVGGRHSHKGAPSNMMCLPPDPIRYSNNHGGDMPAYAVKYQSTCILNNVHNNNMP